MEYVNNEVYEANLKALQAGYKLIHKDLSSGKIEQIFKQCARVPEELSLFERLNFLKQGARNGAQEY